MPCQWYWWTSDLEKCFSYTCASLGIFSVNCREVFFLTFLLWVKISFSSRFLYAVFPGIVLCPVSKGRTRRDLTDEVGKTGQHFSAIPFPRVVKDSTIPFICEAWNNSLEFSARGIEFQGQSQALCPRSVLRAWGRWWSFLQTHEQSRCVQLLQRLPCFGDYAHCEDINVQSLIIRTKW